MDFNPMHIHQDCSEFLERVLLEKLHESLKGYYVSNEKAVEKSSQDDAWEETAANNEKILFRNQENYQQEKSIISDIFGGVVRSEFHVEGSR